MIEDKLRLNDSKTEFMIVGTRQQLAKVNIDQLCVGESSIVPVTSVKNLGSWFDKNMSMTTHIIKVCKAASFHLYNIRRLRKYLTSELIIVTAYYLRFQLYISLNYSASRIVQLGWSITFLDLNI